MMKTFFISLLVLSAAAFADSSIREYRGQVFSLEDQSVCESEFSRISGVVNSIEGAIVLDGGCLMYGEKSVRINFNYESPITTIIEKFRHEFKTAEACEIQASISSRILNNSKSLFVASFCEGRNFRFDYVDKTYSVMRNLRMNANFETRQDCLTEVKNLEKVAGQYNMTTVIATCREIPTIRRDDVFYRADFVYMSVYNKTLNVIRGKEVDGNCLSEQAEIERAFSEADIRLSHQFCSGFGTSREYLVYLDESASVIPAVKVYKGAAYSDAQTCDQKRVDLVNIFSQRSRPTVYSFCEKRMDKKYVPMVYYAQKEN